MRVDTNAIPQQTMAKLCSALLDMVNDYFDDPGTEAEYQAWRKGASNEVQSMPGLRREP